MNTLYTVALAAEVRSGQLRTLGLPGLPVWQTYQEAAALAGDDHPELAVYAIEADWARDVQLYPDGFHRLLHPARALRALPDDQDLLFSPMEAMA